MRQEMIRGEPESNDQRNKHTTTRAWTHPHPRPAHHGRWYGLVAFARANPGMSPASGAAASSLMAAVWAEAAGCRFDPSLQILFYDCKKIMN